MANGATVQATAKGTLPIFPTIPQAARQALVIPGFPACLLSLSQLCTAGCIVHLLPTAIAITYDNHQIFYGMRLPHSFWTMSIPSSPSSHALNVIRHQGNADMVSFYHQALGSPPLPTLEAAVAKGFLSQFPELTVARIRANASVTLATAQGHLNQLRQGLRSTQPQISPTSDMDSTPTLPDSRIYIQVIEPAPPTQRWHADATGRFPVPSHHGNSYMLVFFHEDANYIHVECMKTKATSEYIRVFRNAMQKFQSVGFKPRIQRVDNEISAALIQAMETEFGMITEMAPPGNHRTLRAERAIRTFKDHFISTLCTTDPNFPLMLWDDLIPQTLMTLNILRTCATNPLISAYEAIHGPADFNRFPLIPLGVHVLAFSRPKSATRSTWSPHGRPGFYVGTSPTHYRCFKIWIPESNTFVITDTVQWLFQSIHLPGSSNDELLQSAINALTDVLRVIPLNDSDNFSLPQFRRDLLQLHKAVIPECDIYHHVEVPIANNPLVLPLPPSPIQIVIAPTATPNDPPILQRVIAPTAIPLEPPGLQRVEPILPVPTHPKTARQRRKNPRYAQISTTDAIEPLLPIYVPPTIASIPRLQYSKLIKGPDRMKWLETHYEEFIRTIEETECIEFCSYDEIPSGYKIKHYMPVCKIKAGPNNTLIFRVRGTVADTQSTYQGPKSAATADLETVKLLLNAVVTEKANWMTADIKDYYLGTPMETPEFMSIPMHMIPPQIIQRYNLNPKHKNAYVRIKKGMYGLAQAGRLAQDRLKNHLQQYGYTEAAHTPCLFVHATLDTKFVLIVDDFGIKFTSESNKQHLLECLRKLYIITIDPLGEEYVGLHIKYDRQEPSIQISLPGSVLNYLRRYNFTTRKKPTLFPMVQVPRTFGQHVIAPIPPDTSPILSVTRIKRLQSIIGSFLHYARAVDCTMLMPVNRLASMPTTENTEQCLDQFMHYASCLPNATITYYPSDMQLGIHSDASYLSEPRARSRVGGNSFLGKYDPTQDKAPNGSIENISSILDVIASAVSEAETGAAFVNVMHAIPIRHTLEDLGYPQGPTMITCDNSVAVSIINGDFSPKRSRCMDMRYHFIRDRIKQGQFRIQWLPGANNLADYFTKIHPAAYYPTIRSKYVTDPPGTFEQQRIHLPDPIIPLLASDTVPGQPAPKKQIRFSSEVPSQEGS